MISSITIQKYSPKCAFELVDLFYAAVHSINTNIYSLEEQEAWAPTPSDYGLWFEKFLNNDPYVAAVEKGRVVGFMDVLLPLKTQTEDTTAWIDCLYVHPEYQGIGVAKSLLQAVEGEVYHKKQENKYIDSICVKASKVAKPFFQKYGFEEKGINHIPRGTVTLVNFTMEKTLTSPSFHKTTV